MTTTTTLELTPEDEGILALALGDARALGLDDGETTRALVFAILASEIALRPSTAQLIAEQFISSSK